MEREDDDLLFPCFVPWLLAFSSGSVLQILVKNDCFLVRWVKGVFPRNERNLVLVCSWRRQRRRALVKFEQGLGLNVSIHVVSSSVHTPGVCVSRTHASVFHIVEDRRHHKKNFLHTLSFSLPFFLLVTRENKDKEDEEELRLSSSQERECFLSFASSLSSHLSASFCTR